MIKILIIEDEIPASKKLIRFIEALNEPIHVEAILGTVEQAIDFLQKNTVDLIFSDIELLDGNAFEIYSQVSINCPIVFTTAYDQFVMEAFDTNGISYLLKPFSQERFKKAWEKYKLFQRQSNVALSLLGDIGKLIEEKMTKRIYKKRLTVHAKQGIYFLNISDVVCFEANEGVVFAFDIFGKRHLLKESTLKEVENQVSSVDFFRINRSELVHKTYVERIERFAKNTLAIKLQGYDDFRHTSQSNTACFRSWIDQ